MSCNLPVGCGVRRASISTAWRSGGGVAGQTEVLP